MSKVNATPVSTYDFEEAFCCPPILGIYVQMNTGGLYSWNIGVRGHEQ